MGDVTASIFGQTKVIAKNGQIRPRGSRMSVFKIKVLKNSKGNRGQAVVEVGIGKDNLDPQEYKLMPGDEIVRAEGLVIRHLRTCERF